MKNKKDFINFYESKYKILVNEKFEILLNELRKKVNMSIYIILLIDVLPSIGMIFLINDIVLKLKLLVIFIYNIFIIITIIMSIKRYNREKSYKFNEELIKDILEFIVGKDNYEFVPNNRISKSSFSKTNIFNLEKTNYNGSNYIKVKYKDNDIVIGDFEIFNSEKIISTRVVEKDNKRYLQTISKDKKKIIFSGSYIGATLNKTVHYSIYLIPNTIKSFINSKLNKYIELDGDQLELENIDFNKNYKVYSNDEIKARQILSLTLMEKINNLDTIFPEKKYIVFKDDGRFSIFIQNNGIEDIKNIKLHIVNNEIAIESLIKMFEEINKYFMIYEILGLDQNNN